MKTQRSRFEKRKTHLFLAMLFVALGLPATAQWSVGISGGYAYNHFDYDPQYMEGLHFKGHHGFAIDVPVKYQFNDWLGLSSGLSFQKKGYVLDGSCVLQGYAVFFYENLKRHDSYLVIPVCAEFTLNTKNWYFFLDAGGYVGCWLSSAYEYQTIGTFNGLRFTLSFREPQTQQKEWMAESDRRIECGLAAGLGLQWHVFNGLSLLVTSRCHYALTSQQRDYQIKHFPSRNVTLAIQAGLMYNLRQTKR